MLYLVATPIGNLKDISLRAIETLTGCDYILCEDTRHSKILLKHHNIHVPLRSFHRFNLKQAEADVIADLTAGKTIALISDAGSPLIADPGQELVEACIKAGIAITSIPGACAITTALLLSGFPPSPFQFIGFLPKKRSELEEILSEALLYAGTTLAYDPPHHIEDTLTILSQWQESRQLCIARELTKKYEECLRGTSTELLTHFQTRPPQGEMVLIIAPPDKTRTLPFPSPILIATLETELKLSRKEAMKVAADLTGVPKKQIYNSLIDRSEQD